MIDCGTVKDLLPERAAGTLDGARTTEVDAHLVSCPACAAERNVVVWLARHRAEPPEELAGRIRASLLAEPRRPGRTSAAPVRGRSRMSSWALGLAAALVISLGTAVVWQRTAGPTDDEVWLAYFDGVRAVWADGDGMVAGAPVLDDLSDLTEDDLVALLEELGG